MSHTVIRGRWEQKMKAVNLAIKSVQFNLIFKKNYRWSDLHSPGMFPLIGVGPCAAANHQQKRCADELGEDGPPETHATHVFLTSMTHHVTQSLSRLVSYLHRYVLFQKTDPSYVFKSDLAIMLLLCISKQVALLSQRGRAILRVCLLLALTVQNVE